MFMKRKVYFAGSIRGGRNDAELYKEIINKIKETDIVLTEHIGDLSLSLLENGRDKDHLIYKQDTDWLMESDLLIGECTNPSLGVGYELAFAEKCNVPCHVLYDSTRTQLSAMITGDPYFRVYPYSSREELFDHLERILRDA